MSGKAGRPGVTGFCPSCGARALYLTAGGEVRCGDELCERTDAAHLILSDPETAHLVTLGPEGWTIRHPLIERLDDALLVCSLSEVIDGQGVPRPEDLGEWVAVCEADGEWSMVRPDDGPSR